MDSGPVFQSALLRNGDLNFAAKRSMLLRLIRAAQPITRTAIVERLKIDKSTVTENVKPLIERGILREDIIEGEGRRPRVLSFAAYDDYFVGVNLGVRTSQIGVTNLSGEVTDETEFETPKDAKRALTIVDERIASIRRAHPDKRLRIIGVSVPGMVDALRRELVFAPNLNWRRVAIAEHFQKS